MSGDPLVVLCTCPTNTVAAEIATALVEQHLAACVNQVGSLRSWYRWEGQVREDEEVLLIVKTTRQRLSEVEKAVHALHPARVPEFIALPVVGGSGAYLRWLEESVRP